MKLKVVASAAKPPTVNVKPHGANLTLPANVDVYVLDTATNSTPLAFTIGVVSHRLCNGYVTMISHAIIIHRQLGDMVVSPLITSVNGKECIRGKALALKCVE